VERETEAVDTTAGVEDGGGTSFRRGTGGGGGGKEKEEEKSVTFAFFRARSVIGSKGALTNPMSDVSCDCCGGGVVVLSVVATTALRFFSVVSPR
jgi:hypothetical protein